MGTDRKCLSPTWDNSPRSTGKNSGRPSNVISLTVASDFRSPSETSQMTSATIVSFYGRLPFQVGSSDFPARSEKRAQVLYPPVLVLLFPPVYGSYWNTVKQLPSRENLCSYEAFTNLSVETAAPPLNHYSTQNCSHR